MNRMDSELSRMAITRHIKRYNALPRKNVSAAVTAVAMLFCIALLIFHEPGNDEAEAWLIARNASYRDMIFLIPHYEGHIPLICLTYSIPAKLNLPFKPSVEFLHLVTDFAAIFVLEFKAPFRNTTLTLLPFTYFFMQTEVLCRPYMLLALALFLAASLHVKRNAHPVRYCAVLALMCVTHLFGIAIAGSIAIAWIIELITKERKTSPFTAIRNNIKILLSMTALLVFALSMISLIIPARDILLGASTDIFQYMKTLLKIILFLPSEITFTSFIDPAVLIRNVVLTPLEAAVSSVISLAVWSSFIVYAVRRKKLIQAVLPVVFFALAGAYYMLFHHYAVLYFLGVYIMWILEEGDEAQHGYLNYLLLSFSLVMALMWSSVSCYTEISSDYSDGAGLDRWIEVNSLEDCSFLSGWDVQSPYIISSAYFVNSLNACAGREVCYNLIDGRTYPFLKNEDRHSCDDNIRRWSSYGAPDFIVTVNGEENLKLMLDRLGISDNDYVLVYCNVSKVFYKMTYVKSGIMVWMRSDLAGKIDLNESLDDYNEIYGI